MVLQVELVFLHPRLSIHPSSPPSVVEGPSGTALADAWQLVSVLLLLRRQRKWQERACKSFCTSGREWKIKQGTSKIAASAAKEAEKSQIIAQVPQVYPTFDIQDSYTKFPSKIVKEEIKLVSKVNNQLTPLDFDQKKLKAWNLYFMDILINFLSPPG